ncbi:ABC transporter substrate-binding protein [Erythrobacter sp. LQ02-29]|uniref:ABC transporter substrate-binding protein n=1 Tax=Erythrobacter sp. LQ02-29 TaxID=2920384 RepID=UPI001F4D77CA|nr:ABC transporter substrate-binding protein [Erythrobacter sp. LQ02-29]MCP9221679.1 ABC transporter substrate-binding protein [Erythrobacter sp. LQ02-29]
MRALPILILFLALAIAGCDRSDPQGGVALATIDDNPIAADPGLRLSYAEQQVRGAVAEGLVTLDAAGEVVPAAAESWIVTDDGRSFIFRLRQVRWPDGSELAAREVRDSLQRARKELSGTSLGLDLARIRDIRALTNRVVEVRLTSAMPEFLHLLAQPELGIRKRRSAVGLGPMRLVPERDVSILTFPERAPDEPAAEDRRVVSLRALPAREAIEQFHSGALAAVFDGRLQDWPFADVGPLSRGTIRLDPALGLFGLEFVNADGLLADAARREALSMAIDREALLQPFNVGGITYATRMVPDLVVPTELARGDRWPDLTIAQRQAEAARRIAAWARGSPTPPVLRIALPGGEGGDLLFAGLARDFAAIGVRLERAEEGGPADLRLVDRLARYAAPRWFLNQFNCTISRSICSPDADLLTAQAVAEPDAALSTNLIAEADAALTGAEVFIPLAMPIRWSMVRGSLGGFAENRWGWHPLFPIATAPTS